MTEKIGGSDTGVTVRDGENWRLYGEKWFCSDGDVAILLARPEGADPTVAVSACS